MESFAIELVQAAPGIPALSVVGYFGHEAGTQLQQKVETLLREGQVRLVIDFSRCTVLNSPGVGRLMDMVLIVLDDFKGRLVLAGLDGLKARTLDMAGVIDLTQQAPDIAQAGRVAQQGG